MALVSDGYVCTVTFLDNGRKKTSKRYQLRASTIDHAAAVTAAAALIVDLEAVSELEITSYSVSQVFVEDAISVPTALNAHSEMAALVIAGVEGNPTKSATLMIPAPKDTLFTAAAGFSGYDIVDGADAALIGFMDNFKETGGTFSVSDGEQVADSGSFKSGRRVHRTSRQG